MSAAGDGAFFLLPIGAFAEVEFLVEGEDVPDTHEDASEVRESYCCDSETGSSWPWIGHVISITATGRSRQSKAAK